MEFIKYNDEIAKKTRWDGYYATKSGKILSVKVKGGQGRLDFNKPKELAYKIDRYGYMNVTISLKNDKDEKRNIYPFVHRIVWETFNGEIKDDLTIDHINENCLDNRLENLQLMTREDNGRKAKLGKPSPVKGKTIEKLRIKFELYIDNIPQGIFDRNQLQEEYNIGKWDIDRFLQGKLTKKLIERKITLKRM